MITRKDFERQYSADLLPSSFANYSIGDLWDVKGLFTKTYVPCNENIAEICDSTGALLKTLQSIPMQDANLPDVDMTNDFKSDASLSIPYLGLNLKDVLDANKVEGFHFNSIQGKNIIGYNSNLATSLDAFKTNNFNTYKDKIRDYQVVIGLFYAGSVNLSIDKTVSNQAAIDAKIKAIANAQISVAVDTSDASTIKYSITNSKCPFAAQFKMGRDI
ncbi:MAG TPA: hypothetical protein VKG26_12025 [Bacteroidia bacterium]|nr:hypothetical protein [Bacteroidia bacterium]